VTVHQAYRFALDPTPGQRRALASHAGAARFAFNWGLALVKDGLDRRAAGQHVEVPWTLAALRRAWNQAKHQAAPWWAENSKEAYSSGLDALARALANFSDSRQGRRHGRRVGFPRSKKKGRARDACRFTTGAIRVEPDRKHVTLPRLGTVKTHESTRKLARRIEQGTARILSATISRQADRWFVAFTCEVQRAVPTGPSGRQQQGGTVGVDVGVTQLAVLSTGEQVPNATPLAAGLRRVRAAGRAYARTVAGSRGRAKQAARLARLHARVANQRRDAMAKLTTRLARGHATVVVEDLNVVGMLGNRRLARAIADSGWGELRRQLAYKTAWYGSDLVVADRWYPSSKTCSACGLVRAKLALAERTFTCEGCGLVLDRDANAARNLASLVARSGRETRNARGGDVRPGLAGRTPAKREPCAAVAGKTGTVGLQGPAA